MSVEVLKVTRAYGRQRALDQVSFSLRNGEITGFIGPNGAGKSTMMKIITGFLHPDEGSIMVDGINLREEPRSVQRLIGYLPEHNPLYLNMYVKEYLGFIAGIYGIRKDKSRRVQEIINLTGLEPEQHKMIGALSKGYRQRVGLAQAIIHDPKILILDEPTSGLDPNQIIEIRNLISGLSKDKTVMLSTHIMQEVEAICDRIILINKGKIAADNFTSALIKGTGQEDLTLRIEFNREIPASALQEIPGVLELRSLPDNQWLIAGTSSPDVRKEIFDFAVKNHLIVLSMQKQEKSMEQIFHELTR